MRFTSTLPFLVALALLAPAARASSDYPGVVQSALQLKATPPCTLCHRDDSGGSGTVATPFGTSLQALGLTSKNRGTLEAALATARERRLDSDGDGVTDIDELTTGTSPNDGPGASGGVRAPEYGCSPSPLSRQLPDAGAAMLLVALLVGARARRTR